MGTMDESLSMNVQKVASELISHKAVQSRVNAHVTGEIKRINDVMNKQHSESTKARGKLRAILDENKRAAHDAVVELGQLFTTKIKKIRSEAHEDLQDAKEDLTAKTTKMYEDMADVQLTNQYKNSEAAADIAQYESDMATAIANSKEDFESRMSALANTVASNRKAVERNFEILTGVVRDFKQAGEEDRARIRAQNDVLETDMKKAIATAIQIGEVKARSLPVLARTSLRRRGRCS